MMPKKFTLEQDIISEDLSDIDLIIDHKDDLKDIMNETKHTEDQKKIYSFTKEALDTHIKTIEVTTSADEFTKNIQNIFKQNFKVKNGNIASGTEFTHGDEVLSIQFKNATEMDMYNQFKVNLASELFAKKVFEHQKIEEEKKRVEETPEITEAEKEAKLAALEKKITEDYHLGEVETERKSTNTQVKTAGMFSGRAESLKSFTDGIKEFLESLKNFFPSMKSLGKDATESLKEVTEMAGETAKNLKK